MHMMLYDVVMMNMIYHVVCIVSTMSKDATRCTWCSMMNLDVGNVFIAFQGICRILWRFTPINAMWCSYCRYVCDDHIWKVPFSTSTYIIFLKLHIVKLLDISSKKVSRCHLSICQLNKGPDYQFLMNYYRNSSEMLSRFLVWVTKISYDFLLC